MLFSVALTFLGLTCVTFVIGRVIPIDPVLAIVGDKASRETYDRVRREIGLDQPITGAVLALSGRRCCTAISASRVITSHPVLQDMLHVFPATLELAVLALLVGRRAWHARWAWSPPPIAAAGRTR